MSAVNTGRVIYANLQQIFTDSGTPTGTTKANDPNDPDYIPPFVDTAECPPPTPPPTLINQIQVVVQNNTSQSIGLTSFAVGPLSDTDVSVAYYANANFTILPNTPFNAPLVNQVDDNAYISFGVVGLSKKIRTLITVQYQPSNETSPSTVATFDIVEQQSVNQHFPTVRVANSSATNHLTFILTEDPIPPPVTPPPPVVTGGADQSIQLPTSSATLNGTLSSQDPATTVKWTQVSGPSTATIVTPTGVQTQVNGLVQGTYVFQIVATDSFSQSSSAQTKVVVNPAATNPNGLVNVLVDPAMPDTSFTITQITLYDLVNTLNAPINLLTTPLDKTSGVKLFNPLKGTYRMTITITGATADAMSLNVQWAAGGSSVSVNCPQAGTYAFDNVVVNAGANGVIVNFSSQPASSPTFTVLFAHMVVSSPTTTNQNQLPNDLIVQQNGNVTVNFYSDSGMTTPAPFTGNVAYNITDTNNLTSSSITQRSSTPVNAQNSIVVATLQRYQHYDYSQSSPLVQDDSYTYALVVGQGYLII